MSKRDPLEPSGVAVAEDALQLYRRHLPDLVWYYAGSGLFGAALLYFWADVTWSLPSMGALAADSLVLVPAYIWMRVAQRRYALNLRAHIEGAAPEPWPARRWLVEAQSQVRRQGTRPLALTFAAVATIPLGWACAYYDTVLVAPERAAEGQEGDHARLTRLALLWPMQNHVGLAILAGLWLMVLANVMVGAIEIPWLLSSWLGLKNVFGLQGLRFLNTTFLVYVTVITHLLVDPLIKAFYVVRVFRGESIRSGADLRLVVTAAESLRRFRPAALALLALCLALAPAVSGASPVADPAPASPQELNTAIDGVLAHAEYRWRLRPPPSGAEEADQGYIAGFTRRLAQIARGMAREVRNWVTAVTGWISRLRPHAKVDDATEGEVKQPGGGWMSGLYTFVEVIFFIVAAALVIAIVALAGQRRRRATAQAAGGVRQPVVEPDLSAAEIEPSRLPVEEWIALARVKMARGEWRLALRALFIAVLAQHASEGRLTIGRAKTNLDYERELGRRTVGLAGYVEEFRAKRRRFEDVWYGSETAEAAEINQWVQQLEAR